jgi:hypothetical protein
MTGTLGTDPEHGPATLLESLPTMRLDGGWTAQ